MLTSVDAPVFDFLVRIGISYNLWSLLGTLDGRENSTPVAAAALLFFGAGAIQGAIRLLRKHDVVVAGVG